MFWNGFLSTQDKPNKVFITRKWLYELCEKVGSDVSLWIFRNVLKYFDIKVSAQPAIQNGFDSSTRKVKKNTSETFHKKVYFT